MEIKKKNVRRRFQTAGRLYQYVGDLIYFFFRKGVDTSTLAPPLDSHKCIEAENTSEEMTRSYKELESSSTDNLASICCCPSTSQHHQTIPKSSKNNSTIRFSPYANTKSSNQLESSSTDNFASICCYPSTSQHHQTIPKSSKNNSTIRFSLYANTRGESHHNMLNVNDLIQWILKSHLSRNCCESLLKILSKKTIPILPSLRTLLHTERNITTVTLSGMEYYYFGLRKQIIANLMKQDCQNLHESHDQVLRLSIHIDGMTVFKSSSKTMWPILCRFVDLQCVRVFPVTLTCGFHKPTNLDFLEEFITDLNEIINDGIVAHNEKFSVELHSIVADAPARALVKGTVQFNSLHGCDFCKCLGERVQNRTVFLKTLDLDIRTNNDFRTQTDVDHHKTTTPLTKIYSLNFPLDMPADYMHQVCLGVTKKLLALWIGGRKEKECGYSKVVKGSKKLSQHQVTIVSNKLLELKKFISLCTFSRQPRSLSELTNWKATEFRQFLMYTGKLVLKDTLDKDCYSHFLKLNIAISMLCDFDDHKYDMVLKLLQDFVTDGRRLYGDTFLTYNVHTLLHLPLLCRRFRSLNNINAFPFESYLHQLKKHVKPGNHILKQAILRVLEKQFHQLNADQDLLEASSQLEKCVKSPNNSFIYESLCLELVGLSLLDGNDFPVFTARVYKNKKLLFTRPEHF
jgi:hypothetical protein